MPQPKYHVFLVVAALIILAVISSAPTVLGETQWIKYSSNPILAPSGSWDPAGVVTPRVLFDGTTFRMWYNGVNQQGKYVGIGYATSTDGKNWIANTQPVLTANPNGWKQSASTGIDVGSVVWDGSEFLMWYSGPSSAGIGLATSQDGVNWIKYPSNPVITASFIDSSSMTGPTVIQDSGGFKMWYACQNPSLSYVSICYATSNDGKTWNKYSSPVLTPETGYSWDSANLWSPSVIYDGSVYHMWYTSNAGGSGYYYAIGSATSQDGTTWTRNPNNPILSAGPSGAWDQNGAENPCVIPYKGGFIMFYDGGWQVNNSWPLAYIGMAHSPYFTLGVSVPNQVSVTIDGTQSAGSTSLQLSPGVHTISVPDIVQIDSTSRLKFNGWSDGSTQLMRSFDLESDTEISATYVTQYLVNATSDSTLQSGWYDQGTVVQFTVNNTQLVNQYRLLVGGFSGWYNNGQLIANSASTLLTVNGPVNLTDSWNYLPVLIPLLIVVIVAVILFFARRGTIPTPRLPELKMSRPKRSRRTRRSKPKDETVTPEPEKQVVQTAEVKEVKPSTPAKTIMYCNQCGAVISRDSKFCKECGTKLQQA